MNSVLQEKQPLLKNKAHQSSSNSSRYPENPENHASVWSKIFFQWCNPILDIGATRQLHGDDIWKLHERMKCEPCSKNLIAQWNASQPSLLRAFVSNYGFSYFSLGFILAAGYGCDLFGPVVLEKVVGLLSEESQEVDLSTIWIWLALLFFSRVLKSIVFAHFYYLTQVIMLRFTSALKGAVYQKTFRLSSKSRGEKNTGDIVNIYTTDVNNIINAAFFIHYMWVLPLEILVVAWMLYNVVGSAMFAGFAVIVIVLLFNNVLAKLQSKTFKKIMEIKDDRMKVVNEIFGSMQIVKLNAWEKRFYDKLGEVRTRELKEIWHWMVIAGLNIFLLWGAPVFVSTTVFAVYGLWLKETLTAAKMFTAIALFRLLQEPLRSLPSYITGLIQAGVSLDRLLSFSELEEVDPSNVIGLENGPIAAKYSSQNIAVAIEHGTFAWESKENAPTVFKDINVSIKHGDFVVVHGKVGSGKSSLCSVLLGEMVKTTPESRVFVGGSVAYCPQQAWIQHMSIRKNILFGKPYDKRLYNKVVEACGLTKDMELFSAGDATEIGEKGLNLSGGQKARISIARACYSNADIYIFDSPLSAVDAIVQNEIFTKCFIGLLQHKTRILVTHNPDIIDSPHVNTTLELGTAQFVSRLNTSVSKKTMPDVSAISPLPPSRGSRRTKKAPVFALDLPLSGSACTTPIAMEDTVKIDDFVPLTRRTSSFANAQGRASVGQLVAEEERSEGRVSGHVFQYYFAAVGGYPTLIFLIVIQSLWQYLQISSDFWLNHWTNESVEDQAANVTYNIQVYAAYALGGALMVLIRTLTISWQGLSGAKKMFDQMTVSLLKAPQSFFDANPLGRQLNRYSDDTSNVDLRLPFSCGSLLANLFSVGATLATAAILTRFLGLTMIPMVYLYIKIAAYYLKSARELQRLQKVSQSPVLANVSESYDGSSVIRAFDDTDRFVRYNESIIDKNNENQFVLFATAEWFAMRMQLLGGVVLLLVTGSLVFMRNYLSAGIVGLAFNYALMVDQGLESMIQIWSNIETSMVSPERIAEYIALTPEAPHEIPETEPPTSWPEKGTVEFQNVSFRYKQAGDLILRDLSFSLKAAEKIGIVGRTGAGKSSLTMALFRINEICSGSIFIDNIDVSKLGLRTLRSRLSIITQSPVLFKGTLRGYLDPFDDYTDVQLWASINKVGLNETISNLEGKLEAPLEENGSNFSVGERQLLCMSRSLLSDSRVVIMDEATAAVDQKTDALLQKVIREEFTKSTVITIAHRLDTVLDADRIMVLDAGRIVELDSPMALIKKGKGHFYDLAKEGGYLDRMNYVVLDKDAKKTKQTKHNAK